MNSQPVLIAGGGIGGLATALGLARKGARSIVLERAAELGEIGAGIQISPLESGVYRQSALDGCS